MNSDLSEEMLARFPGKMPKVQWDAFCAMCDERKIPVTEENLRFGSLLDYKAVFISGWEARNAVSPKEMK